LFKSQKIDLKSHKKKKKEMKKKAKQDSLILLKENNNNNKKNKYETNIYIYILYYNKEKRQARSNMK